MEPRWWENTTLEKLTQDQWEGLCDGCGLCCSVKFWDENGVALNTKIACTLMDLKTGKCKDYDNRFTKVRNCHKLTPDNLDTPGMLPVTCAYRLVRDGKPLHWWHHLISGSTQTVVEAGISIVGFAETNEDQVNAWSMRRYIMAALEKREK